MFSEPSSTQEIIIPLSESCFAGAEQVYVTVLLFVKQKQEPSVTYKYNNHLGILTY